MADLSFHLALSSVRMPGVTLVLGGEVYPQQRVLKDESITPEERQLAIDALVNDAKAAKYKVVATTSGATATALGSAAVPGPWTIPIVAIAGLLSLLATKIYETEMIAILARRGALDSIPTKIVSPEVVIRSDAGQVLVLPPVVTVTPHNSRVRAPKLGGSNATMSVTNRTTTTTNTTSTRTTTTTSTTTTAAAATSSSDRPTPEPAPQQEETCDGTWHDHDGTSVRCTKADYPGPEDDDVEVTPTQRVAQIRAWAELNLLPRDDGQPALDDDIISVLRDIREVATASGIFLEATTPEERSEMTAEERRKDISRLAAESGLYMDTPDRNDGDWCYIEGPHGWAIVVARSN